MNPLDAAALTLEDLAHLAGETTRTIRYYTQEGLLASPGLGRGVRYGPEHLDRLLLIQALQARGLPLIRIRERLQALAPEEVREALLEARRELEEHRRAEGQRPESAAEYAERYLTLRETRRASSAGAPALSKSASSAPDPPMPAPVTWDRYVLVPDVEIHVRRPLSPPDQRRLRKLIRFGRELFEPHAASQASLFSDPSGDSEP